MQGRDARIQGRIEPDGVGVGREQRSEFCFEVIAEVVGVGRALIEEDFGDSGKRLPAALERDERVLEVAASALPVIALTSASCSLMPCRNAGR